MRHDDLLGIQLAETAAFPGVTVADMEAAGLIVNFGDGHWLYGPAWTRVAHAIQAHYVSALCSQLGFQEWIFSRSIPVRSLDSFELTHYRPGMLIAANAYEHTDHATADTRILDPVQCLPFYEMHRGKTLDVSSSAVAVVEHLGGWTWREEVPKELQGPIRAREFARIEAAFIGTPQDVTRLRSGVENIMLETVTALGLSWRVVVGVGCMEIEELDRRRETATSATEVPVHDVEVLTAESEWLEIAGCTVEGEHLITGFDIKGDGVDLWSGCCGLGLNRLISACFMTHGLDVDSWPPAVHSWLSHGDSSLTAALLGAKS